MNLFTFILSLSMISNSRTSSENSEYNPLDSLFHVLANTLTTTWWWLSSSSDPDYSNLEQQMVDELTNEDDYDTTVGDNKIPVSMSFSQPPIIATPFPDNDCPEHQNQTKAHP